MPYGKMPAWRSPCGLPLSRNARKRKRAERRRREERESQRLMRRLVEAKRQEELDRFGHFINTHDVELMVPKVRLSFI